MPQGSVMGPLLYIFYVQSLTTCKLSSQYTIYADDTILLYAGKDHANIQQTLNDDLTTLENWLAG